MTDLKAAAEAAKAATAAYIADPTDRETGRQWDRACAEFSLACTEDAILALYAEIEKITRHSEALAFDLDRAVMERDEARAWQEPVNLREEISAFAGRCAVAMWDPSPADIERARRQMEDDMLAVAMHLAGPYRARAEAAEAALSAAQEEVERWRNAPRVEFHQQDWLPGFAAFLPDATTLSPSARAFCVLNLGSFLATVEAGHVAKSELPYFIASSMMHEVMHVLEQWAGVEFSEERVESLLEKYRAATLTKEPHDG